MTVAELILALQQQPPELDVMAYTMDQYGYAEDADEIIPHVAPRRWDNNDPVVWLVQP